MKSRKNLITRAGILHLKGSLSALPRIDWSAMVVLLRVVLFRLALFESSGSKETKKDRLNSTNAKAERDELTVLNVN